MLGHFRMRDVMANGPYTHSSVTGNMVGTGVIPDFLDHCMA